MIALAYYTLAICKAREGFVNALNALSFPILLLYHIILSSIKKTACHLLYVLSYPDHLERSLPYAHN